MSPLPLHNHHMQWLIFHPSGWNRQALVVWPNVSTHSDYQCLRVALAAVQVVIALKAPSMHPLYSRARSCCRCAQGTVTSMGQKAHARAPIAAGIQTSPSRCQDTQITSCSWKRYKPFVISADLTLGGKEKLRVKCKIFISCESVCWWKEKEYFNKLFTTSLPPGMG